MEQSLLNAITAITGIGTLMVTMAGLFAVYIQVKKLRESIWSNTHGKLCDQSFELIKFLAEKPATYDYFYKKKILEEGNKDKVFILYAAEAITNFLEHLVLQRQHLPKEQWEIWQRFIHSTYKNSIVMREFIKVHRDWYSDELLSIADKCDRLY